MKSQIKLRPDPKNARRHSERNKKAIRQSLEAVGGGRSILVDGQNIIRAGNGVYEQAQELGLKVRIVDAGKSELIAVRRKDLKGKAAIRAAMLDNLAADTSYADYDAAILTAIAKDDELIAQLANDDAKIAALIQAQNQVEETVDASELIDRAAELQKKWQVARGDLWEIQSRSCPGKAHRILCGDSTSAGDVQKLMQGEKAVMIFEDPPYNVASNSRNYAADKSKAMSDLANAEWDKNFDIKTVFPTREQIVMANDCAVYVCTSHWLVQTVWEWMWGWSDFCSYVVYCKPNPMPSLSKRHWTWATELIAYATRGEHVSNFPSEGHALNWWAIPKQKETEHPTEKPIPVPSRAIDFSSKRGNIVFDGFLGSGTTLVACEQTRRIGRGIEIEPKYVAVALERLANLGLQPKRIENGKAKK